MKSNAFALPSAFLGTWQGTPDFNILGPGFGTNIYHLGIAQAPNGDYFMENNLLYDDVDMGHQRFYLEGSDNPGLLWYCGYLIDFPANNGTELAGAFRPDALVAMELTSSSATFCIDSDSPDVMGKGNPYQLGCTFCDCGNWTLSYSAETDTLSSQFSMAGAPNHTKSKHLWIELTRSSTTPPPLPANMPGHGADFSCDFTEIGGPTGRDSAPVVLGGCPFLAKKNKSGTTERLGARMTGSNAVSNKAYDHCYVLNKFSDFRLSWTVDAANEMLNVKVSAAASTDSTWVAIGFRPLSRAQATLDDALAEIGTGDHMKFGMAGADIVAGSSNGGVRSLYAVDYTGPPIVDDSLLIFNATASFAGGVASVEFYRPFVSGYLLKNYNIKASVISDTSDIIWAVGSDTTSSDTGCSYHSNKRGLRVVNWNEPDNNFDDAMKC
jgi:hypothetical protein